MREPMFIAAMDYDKAPIQAVVSECLQGLLEVPGMTFEYCDVID